MTIRGLAATLTLACALVLSAVTAPRADMSDGIKKLYEAAKKEGEATWYVSQHDLEFAEKIASDFARLYPGVKINVVRTTGQVQYQRFTQEVKADTVAADVYSTYEDGHLVEMKKNNQIANYVPENLKGLEKSLQDAAETGYWEPTSVAPVAIGYNTQLVKKEDAPKSWKDLLDPKWKGQIGIGHPGFSGSVGIWCIALQKMYGWDYFTQLAKNEPQIGRSIVDGYNLILSGERKVALVPTALTTDGEAKGSPVATSFPEDGTVVLPGSTAIPAKAPHPNAARLFLEYLLSKDHSTLLATNDRIPLRADAPKPPHAKPLDELKVVTVPTADTVSKMNEIKEKFRDTFGI